MTGGRLVAISSQDIRGIIVPMVTPFKGKNYSEIDTKATERLTNYLVQNGVSALMPLGTSGEFAFLDRPERRVVIDAVVKSAKGRKPVVAGVSAAGTNEAIEFAQDAEEVGADAIISTGPYYYKTEPEGLLIHYESLLEAVDLPLMVYNIPQYAGYNIPARVVEELVRKYPRRILGVKFTTNDLGEFLKYLRPLKDKISIMIGSDALIFSAIELGAAGAVVGSGNVFPRETSDIYNSYTNGDHERSKKLQEKIDPFTETMVLGTYPAALKEAMKLIGLDCGGVRRPLLQCIPADAKKVKTSISWKLNRPR